MLKVRDSFGTVPSVRQQPERSNEIFQDDSEFSTSDINISNFFSLEDSLTRCFDYDKIMDYVGYIDKDPVCFSIVLTISSFSKNKYIDKAKNCLFKRFFEVSIPSLQAWLLLWAYMRTEMAHDDILDFHFNQVIHISQKLGIFGDVSQMFKNESARFRRSLLNVRNLILLESDWQSFRQGIPPSINSDSVSCTISISLNQNITDPVDLLGYIEQIENSFLSKAPLFQGSFFQTMEHEVWHLNILVSLYAIQIYYRETHKIEGFRYWLISVLLLKRLSKNIDMVQEIPDPLYRSYAFQFSILSEFLIRTTSLAVLFTLDNNDSGATNTPLAYELEDILTLQPEILQQFLNRDLIIDMTAGTLPTAPSWKFYHDNISTLLNNITRDNYFDYQFFDILEFTP